MKHFRPFATAVLLASALVLICFLAACETSKPTAASLPAGGEKVFIQFEGPWAFEADPKDDTMVFAIAPKAKGHHDLFVKSSNQSSLASGMYELAVPPRTGPAAGTVETGIFRAKPDAASLQRALDAKGERYAIRMPKPEVYKIANRHRSRVDTIYPPAPKTEDDYATEIALQYTVTTLTGFSLSGTVDSGTYSPMLLNVETPHIRFVIEPDYDDPADQCSLHSRESFRDLTKLLNLAYYVDFPEDGQGGQDCHKTDPQNPNAAPARKANLNNSRGLGHLASFTLLGKNVEHGFASVMYFFFGKPAGDCKAPEPVGP